MTELDLYGFKYRVLFDVSVDDHGISGEFRQRRSEIAINPRVSKQEQEETLLHEIIEALNEFGCFDFEHETISRLSHGLFQIFKTNGIDFLSQILNSLDPFWQIIGTNWFKLN
mgnify:CR=1 FL=1